MHLHQRALQLPLLTSGQKQTWLELKAIAAVDSKERTTQNLSLIFLEMIEYFNHEFYQTNNSTVEKNWKRKILCSRKLGMGIRISHQKLLR